MSSYFPSRYFFIKVIIYQFYGSGDYESRNDQSKKFTQDL